MCAYVYVCMYESVCVYIYKLRKFMFAYKIEMYAHKTGLKQYLEVISIKLP